MSKKAIFSKSAWTWLPGETERILCGIFTLNAGVGFGRSARAPGAFRSRCRRCESFAYERAAAIDFIDQARDILLKNWPLEVQACGHAPEILPIKDPIFWLDQN
jgi:hypothetical protein